jgi:hypothetical protein
MTGIVDASRLVPKDRPIDGVDALAFMLGNNNTPGRDSYILFGIDSERRISSSSVNISEA